MEKKKQTKNQKSLFTLIPYPNYSTIHAVPYFMVGIICGPIWGSFPVRDHSRSNLGIICGPGSLAVPGSFAKPYSILLKQTVPASRFSFDFSRKIERETARARRVRRRLLYGKTSPRPIHTLTAAHRQISHKTT